MRISKMPSVIVKPKGCLACCREVQIATHAGHDLNHEWTENADFLAILSVSNGVGDSATHHFNAQSRTPPYAYEMSGIDGTP